MHAIAGGGGGGDTVRESVLKVDSGRYIPCRTGESKQRQRRAGPMLYQLSYIPTENEETNTKQQNSHCVSTWCNYAAGWTSKCEVACSTLLILRNGRDPESLCFRGGFSSVLGNMTSPPAISGRLPIAASRLDDVGFVADTYRIAWWKHNKIITDAHTLHDVTQHHFKLIPRCSRAARLGLLAPVVTHF